MPRVSRKRRVKTRKGRRSVRRNRRRTAMRGGAMGAACVRCLPNSCEGDEGSIRFEEVTENFYDDGLLQKAAEVENRWYMAAGGHAGQSIGGSQRGGALRGSSQRIKAVAFWIWVVKAMLGGAHGGISKFWELFVYYFASPTATMPEWYGNPIVILVQILNQAALIPCLCMGQIIWITAYFFSFTNRWWIVPAVGGTLHALEVMYNNAGTIIGLIAAFSLLAGVLGGLGAGASVGAAAATQMATLCKALLIKCAKFKYFLYYCSPSAFIELIGVPLSGGMACTVDTAVMLAVTRSIKRKADDAASGRISADEKAFLKRVPNVVKKVVGSGIGKLPDPKIMHNKAKIDADNLTDLFGLNRLGVSVQRGLQEPWYTWAQKKMPKFALGDPAMRPAALRAARGDRASPAPVARRAASPGRRGSRSRDRDSNSSNSSAKGVGYNSPTSPTKKKGRKSRRSKKRRSKKRSTKKRSTRKKRRTRRKQK